MSFTIITSSGSYRHLQSRWELGLQFVNFGGSHRVIPSDMTPAPRPPLSLPLPTPRTLVTTPGRPRPCRVISACLMPILVPPRPLSPLPCGLTWSQGQRTRTGRLGEALIPLTTANRTNESLPPRAESRSFRTKMQGDSLSIVTENPEPKAHQPNLCDVSSSGRKLHAHC